jgi:hypothetical protein
MYNFRSLKLFNVPKKRNEPFFMGIIIDFEFRE